MNGTAFANQVMHEPPFSTMHPKLAGFLKEYLADTKVTEFNGRHVVDVHFPPFPSPAFDTMAAHFNALGDCAERSLFSVTLAVTNRCMYRCWHCYNAGRCQEDLPLEALRDTVRQLREMNVVHVTLTGGEPLLRGDLEEVIAAFGGGVHLTLNTTGRGLTPARARSLREAGLFALGVSLDSLDPAEHDRLRGHAGAFDTAVAAVGAAADAGLYPYVITVARRELLAPDRFWALMRFAGGLGAREMHLLEPCATGNLAGHDDVMLRPEEEARILAFQREAARREDLPTLSTFLHLESPQAFGCGAGLTHLYVDGAGEVGPCNLLPLSFGNVTREPLADILDRMGAHFRRPRTGCVGKLLCGRCGADGGPLGPEASAALCEAHLPKEHDVPRFFRLRTEAQGDVGAEELKTAYNRIHADYDAFWVVEAGKPVRDLVARVPFRGRVFEAGCGTGYATAAIAERLGGDGEITAADLSEGMLAEARGRVLAAGFGNVRFLAGDALELLAPDGAHDVVFSSWVLGYIPVAPFLRRAAAALAPGGLLAFVVHKENSPREPLEIFGDLVAEDPAVLDRRVAFDFPRDMDQVRGQLLEAGLEPEALWDGAITFQYATAEEVLEHLLKSGAGTAFHDAVNPAQRDGLERRFLEILASRHDPAAGIPVAHDYIACIARKPAL